jgi:hypothetical protein
MIFHYLSTIWLGFLNHVGAVTNFFSKEKFLVPFLATLVASLTILLVNRLNERSKTKKKKIYAVTYIADSLQRALHCSLIIKIDTIIPHIEAVERILQGEYRILEQMIENDDINILQDDSFHFPSLPENYKILLGIDDIEIIQMWDAFRHLQEKAAVKKHLWSEELSNFDSFMSLSQQRREQILRQRRDFLERKLLEADRTIQLIRLFYPRVRRYMDGINFVFRSKTSFRRAISHIEHILASHADYLPPANFLEQRRVSGIKQAL